MKDRIALIISNHQMNEAYMTKREFAKRYAPHNRMNEFWLGWLAQTGPCPYEKDTPKATAWWLGMEAREDYETEQ